MLFQIQQNSEDTHQVASNSTHMGQIKLKMGMKMCMKEREGEKEKKH